MMDKYHTTDKSIFIALILMPFSDLNKKPSLLFFIDIKSLVLVLVVLSLLQQFD